MMQPGTQSDEEPKEGILRVLLRSKPNAEFGTSAGTIYLYPLRMRDMADFERLKPADSASQIRAFLSSIASLNLGSDEATERTPLDIEIANGLSDEEIERVAEVYAQSSTWQTLHEESQEIHPDSRPVDETASDHLVRLLNEEVEHHRQSAKKLTDKLLGASSGLFDQVRKSTSALGSTLSAFDKLTKLPSLKQTEFQPFQADNFSKFNDLMAQQARERATERAEEMDLARLTGQMTAESARTLKDLAEAATNLMAQMDSRDQRADKSTRKQVTIAVWSVALSAALALLALIVSGLGYVQDRRINTSGDQRQEQLMKAIEIAGQQRFAVATENQALGERLQLLQSKLAQLEFTQRAAEETTAKTEARTLLSVNPSNKREKRTRKE